MINSPTDNLEFWGILPYFDLDEAAPDGMFDLASEDLCHVKKGDALADIGVLPFGSRHAYVCRLVLNGDWDNPSAVFSTPSAASATKWFYAAVDIIQSS